MKRYISFTLAFAMSLCCLLSGCAQEQENPSSAPDEQSTSAVQSETIQSTDALPIIRVGALQGPTGLGLVELMEKNEKKEATNLYEFTLAGAPDELSGKIINGELDIACLPTNVASVLYAKTEGKVNLLAVNTLGVLYMLQKNDADVIGSIDDLSGETIYSTGQGATQEYVLDYLLTENGVEDAEVVYKSEHAELATLMIEGSAEYALLPQPFVTTVTSKDDTVDVALDITEEWETVTDGKQLTMGCVIVRTEFLEQNQAAVDTFLEELAQSVEFANTNVDEAAAYSGKFEVVNQEIAQKAIPECNIVCITGEEMQTSVSAYLEVLNNANPQSIGGALPDEAFYYLP